MLLGFSVRKKAFVKAHEAIRKKRVVKLSIDSENLELWLVYSPKRRRVNIVVDKDYCTCLSYYKRLLTEGKGWCYHIMAVSLAKKTGQYQEDKVDRKFFIKNICMRILYLQ